MSGVPLTEERFAILFEQNIQKFLQPIMSELHVIKSDVASIKTDVASIEKGVNALHTNAIRLLNVRKWKSQRAFGKHQLTDAAF